jgi:transcriptional regulator of aroF, aroG, tyrA and aromatic amino acid transport
LTDWYQEKIFMRIDVLFYDRVGITQQVLQLLAERDINLSAVEMAPPHVYIDAPQLDQQHFAELRRKFFEVEGVRDVRVVSMLPGQRRGLHLQTLMEAMADPVFVVDGEGAIVVASAAAASVVGLNEAAMVGISIGELFGDVALQSELRNAKFAAPAREVMLQGQPFLLDVTPVLEDGTVVGGVITLNAPRRIGERLHALQHFDEGGVEKILGESAPMKALKERAARVASVDAPLLILGETGTGKELVAHACHYASARCKAPFLALNCAALPESLAESELFGYAPGAFSGAQRGGKPGLLELANHGTVFLDEIGEMSLYLQAKLLRFLNDGSFRRVGGDRELKVNVRIISATHRALDRMVGEGSFREDLYYRLNVLSLRVPPLRERREDIPLLAQHFIERACTQVQRPLCRLSPTAMSAMLDNEWRGNVRQLQNVIFRAVTMGDSSRIDAADLDLAAVDAQPSAPAAAVDITNLEEAVSAYERNLLQQLYARHPSCRKLASHLKVPHTTIAYKLRKYGIPGS